MLTLLRTYFIISSLAISLMSCEVLGIEDDATQITDTVTPVLQINGARFEKMYLSSANPVFEDPGVTIFKYDAVAGELRNVEEKICKAAPSDFVKDGSVIVTGTVNSTATGTYVLTYNYKDCEGHEARPVHRTIYVVEHELSFLKGIYNVACTCTAVASGSSMRSVTTDNYIASVSMGQFIDRFEISLLKLGPVDVAPSAFLRGNSIDLNFNINPVDFDQNAPSSGTLSPSKNTFTIETKVQKWIPSITYICKNIFTNSKSEKLTAKIN